ncbi:MAG: hypothetical protein ACE5LX_03390 [Nitrospinota bacterium]
MAYQETSLRTNGTKQSSSSTNQNYILGLRHMVSPVLDYRLNMRASDVETLSTPAAGTVQKTESKSLEPSIDISLQNPLFNFSIGAREIDGENVQTGNPRQDLRSRSYYSSVDWTPPNFPSLRLNVRRDEEKRSERGNPRLTDTITDNYILISGYSLDPFRLTYNLSGSRTDDMVARELREITTNVGRADFSRTYWGGKLAASANYQFSETREESNINPAGKTSTQSAIANFTATPYPWGTLGYNFSLNLTDTDPGVPSETRTTHTVNLIGRPDPRLTSTLLLRLQDTSPSRGPSSRANFYSLTLSSMPIPALDTTLSVTRDEQEEGGRTQSRTDSLLFQGVGKILDGFTLSMEGSLRRGENFQTRALTETNGLSAIANMQFTRNFSLLSSYTFTRNITHGPGIIRTVTSKEEIRNSMVYRPSPQISAAAIIELNKVRSEWKHTQSYNIDWRPFPRAAMDVSLSYRLQRSEVDGSKTEGINAQLRWALNRNLQLRFTYQRSQVANATSSTRDSYAVTLNFHF